VIEGIDGRVLKEAIQRESDLEANGVRDFADGWNYGGTGQHRSLAERYGSGEVEIHIRFFGSWGDHPMAKLLAVIHRTSRAKGHLGDEIELHLVKLFRDRGRDGKVDPVLVDAVEFMNGPEPVAFKVGPGVEGLKVSDEFLGSGGHIPVAPRSGPESLGAIDGIALRILVPEDREFRGCFGVGRKRSAPVSFGISLAIEGQGEMIQPATHVVKRLPDQIGPMAGDRVVTEDIGGSPALWIMLSDDSTRIFVEPATDGGIQGVRVFERTAESAPVTLQSRYPRLSMASERKPKQKTGKGLEIPVPSKGDFDRAMRKVAPPARRKRPDEKDGQQKRSE
jgi:hypothetical protein